MEEIHNALDYFRGEIEQLPPIYSAIKVNGKKLYDIARNGGEIERKPRNIKIFDITDIFVDLTRVSFTVSCSKGTYIRALARDIGQALESGAHLISLRRTRVGDVKVEDCMKVEDFADWLDKQQIDIS